MDEVLPILRSPRTHGELEVVRSVDEMLLRDRRTGERFPVRDGVAELLVAAAVTGLNRRYQRFYDRAAPLYDAALGLAARLARGREADLRREYLGDLEVEPGDRVLEVSVGTGANLRLLPPGLRLVGLDISRGMLRRCRRNLRRWGVEADLILGDAEELPFVDDAFDAVLHVGGINAFNDRQRALAEMFRVARPGAKVVVVDETGQLIDRFAWFPGARQMKRSFAERFEAPVGLVPAAAVEVGARPVVHGDLYCMSFRKPG